MHSNTYSLIKLATAGAPGQQPHEQGGTNLALQSNTVKPQNNISTVNNIQSNITERSKSDYTPYTNPSDLAMSFRPMVESFLPPYMANYTRRPLDPSQQLSVGSNEPRLKQPEGTHQEPYTPPQLANSTGNDNKERVLPQWYYQARDTFTSKPQYKGNYTNNSFY